MYFNTKCNAYIKSDYHFCSTPYPFKQAYSNDNSNHSVHTQHALLYDEKYSLTFAQNTSHRMELRKWKQRTCRSSQISSSWDSSVGGQLDLARLTGGSNPGWNTFDSRGPRRTSVPETLNTSKSVGPRVWKQENDVHAVVRAANFFLGIDASLYLNAPLQTTVWCEGRDPFKVSAPRLRRWLRGRTTID